MELFTTLMMGFCAGGIFGFLLRKGFVTRPDIIIQQFLLRDFTVLKIMMTAIVVGSIGVYALHDWGVITKLPVKNAFVLANLSGGAIFGLGMAILGLCPGTCIGAIGEGSKEGLVGLLGMLTGAFLFVELYDFLYPLFFAPIDLGKATLPTLTGLSPWFFIAGITCFAVALFVVIEKFERKMPKTED